MQTVRELSQVIARHCPDSGIVDSAVPALWLIRADAPSVPVPAVYEASLCLIAQGAKRVSSGEHSVIYDEARYLVVSLDLPIVGHVIEASADRPYLCCKIDLDLAALSDLLAAEDDVPRIQAGEPLAVYPSDPELVDAVVRLVSLLDKPAAAIAALAPLIQREILYRLLAGPHGAILRQIATADTHLNQIARAMAAIRKRFDRQMRIADVAAEAGMSESSLFAHFKAVTRMTPLEYQKHLRLQEARRLMLTEGASAGAAGFAVGYDSPSQFSREFRRLFGAPPRSHIDTMRAQDMMASAA